MILLVPNSESKAHTAQLYILFSFCPKIESIRFSPKRKKLDKLSSFWFLVSAEGFEPSTASLEGRCSIQLSYAPVILVQPTDYKKSQQRWPFFVSGWQDSNLRPPRPKRGAMTGLRYTPSLKSEI